MTAILLEVDGTLVDTNYLHVDAWARALAEIGITVPRATLHRQIGKGADQLLPMFVHEERARARADERHLVYMRELERFATPLPGARGLLEALAGVGHSLWLATSARPDELRARLKQIGVSESLFKGVVSAGEVARSKPQPDIFLEAARAVAVLTGGAFSYSELIEAGAMAVFEDCADLLARGLSVIR